MTNWKDGDWSVIMMKQWNEYEYYQHFCNSCGLEWQMDPHDIHMCNCGVMLVGKEMELENDN